MSHFAHEDEAHEFILKIHAALQTLGPPHKVLPACLIIAARYAATGGTSIEDFVNRVQEIAQNEFENAKRSSS
jgi:hypothetical protein